MPYNLFEGIDNIMSTCVLICIFMSLVSHIGFGQGYCIKGNITGVEGPIPYASIAWGEHGTYADGQGNFSLCISEKEPPQVILVSAVGYFTDTINYQKISAQPISISMKEDRLGLDEVVITGSQLPTYKSKSPVKVEVVQQEYIQKFVPTNKSIMESVSLINGVQTVVGCGVCYTNSITINGLPGRYTMVLVDGMPMYGNLSTVYGLNGIPNQIIDRMEVIKGPSSTLYGSEAIAGVINVITKNPEEQPFASLDLMGTTNLETFGNFSLSGSSGNLSAYGGLNYGIVKDWDDNNNDGFNDMVNMEQYNGFAKFQFKRKASKQASLALQYNYEDRANGLRPYLDDNAYRSIRGNDSIYGESIYTNRFAAFGSYDFRWGENLRLDYNVNFHEQNSYYGSDFYKADQRVGFLNLYETKRVGSHTLMGGVSGRYQRYDDNTVATETANDQGEVENRPQESYIPGIWVQDEWEASKKWILLGGMRVDYYNSHGLIPSPRISAKYQITPYTSARLNTGTGFKVVNLFTEDHAFVSGQRQVFIREGLNPETAYNVSTNLTHTYLLGDMVGTLDVDVFYTHFFNQINPSYEEEQFIIYENLDGYSYTRGVAAMVNHSFSFPLSVQLSATWQQVREVNTGGSRPLEFAADYLMTLNASYEIGKWGLTLASNTRLTGPMQMPEVYDLGEDGEPLQDPRPLRSEPFLVQNVQVTKQLGKQVEVYGGYTNVFNEQPAYSPLAGFNDPNNPTGFSPFFDTAYTSAPWHEPEVYVGLRLSTKR